MNDFAEHWAGRMMPEMRLEVRKAAIRIITATEDAKNWETFNANLTWLEDHAHRLGASHMPDNYQAALHNELKRLLVDAIGEVATPFRQAEPGVAMVVADVARWQRQFAEWAGLRDPDRPMSPAEQILAADPEWVARRRAAEGEP